MYDPAKKVRYTRQLYAVVKPALGRTGSCRERWHTSESGAVAETLACCGTSLSLSTLQQAAQGQSAHGSVTDTQRPHHLAACRESACRPTAEFSSERCCCDIEGRLGAGGLLRRTHCETHSSKEGRCSNPPVYSSLGGVMIAPGTQQGVKTLEGGPRNTRHAAAHCWETPPTQSLPRCAGVLQLRAPL